MVFQEFWALNFNFQNQSFLQVQQHQYSIEPNQQIYLNKGGVSSAEMGMMSTPTTQCKFWRISVRFYTELFPWSFCYRSFCYKNLFDILLEIISEYQIYAQLFTISSFKTCISIFDFKSEVFSDQ